MPKVLHFIRIGIIICSVFISKNINAQDPYFSQFFLNPVFMNPAYTGSMKVPRAGVQYRNQWPAMDKAYVSYLASFDTYLPSVSGGIGLMLSNDIQGDGIYTEKGFRFMFSKEIKLSREWTMYGSITAGAQLNSVNFDQLVFFDGLDPLYGQHRPTTELLPDNNNLLIPDFSTGILVFNDKYFFGIAADHLNKPNQSVYFELPNYLNRKYTMHFEVNLPWFRPGHWRKFCTFNPNFILKMQGADKALTWGLYANRRGFSLGIWNRLTTASSSDMILMAGFMGKQFKSAISYDINIYGVGLRSHGAFELSISYLLKDPGRKSIFPFYEIPGEWDIN